MKMLRFCLLAILLFVAQKAYSFVIPNGASIARFPQSNRYYHESCSSSRAIVARSPLPSKTTAMRPLLAEQRKADPGGMQRGSVIMAIVMAACVWIFSIPPEFRRAKLCNAEQSNLYAQCQTPQQWRQGIAEYYRNGGGIQFDFSIDPGTLAENEELRKSIFK